MTKKQLINEMKVLEDGIYADGIYFVDKVNGDDVINDWKENSQQFEKEEKVIYSNDLPNEKYTFMEQEE